MQYNFYAVSKDRNSGLVHARIEDNDKRCLGLFDIHVSDRHGTTFRELNVFEPRLLEVKELILQAGYDAMKENRHRTVLKKRTVTVLS